MSKSKNPINASGKRFLYIILGVTAVASLLVVALATIGDDSDGGGGDGSASITNLVPRSTEGDATPSQAALERLERVQREEADAAKIAGKTYIPENYLGSPRDIRESISSGELDERVIPSYQHYQESQDNFTRQQSVSLNEGTQEQGIDPFIALESGVMNQVQGIMANLGPATVDVISISEWRPREEVSAGDGSSGGQEGGGAGRPEGELLIQADDILTAVILTPIDTYTTQFVLAEIVGGDFNGAQLRGNVVPMTASGDVEDVGVRFTSMSLDGRFYPINAIALNENTATDAMDGNVDRRVFSRYVMPIFSASLSGVAKYFTARGTVGESLLRGGGYDDVVVERRQADREDAKNQAIGEMADKTVQLAQDSIDREAARPQRITMAAGTPIGLIFNAPVFAQ